MGGMTWQYQGQECPLWERRKGGQGSAHDRGQRAGWEGVLGVQIQRVQYTHETHRLGVFSSNETFKRRLFLRTKKNFELFERLWGGCVAANIVMKCSTQLFLRVWFFQSSLQPPECPENVFSNCGGFFFQRTFECSNEDIFRRKGRGVSKCTYRPTGNNRTAQPPVSLSNVAFSVLAHDSLPDTCTTASSFFSVSSFSPSPASSSSCLPPLFVGVFLFFSGLFAFTCYFLALGAGTPPVADATAAAFLHSCSAFVA